MPGKTYLKAGLMVLLVLLMSVWVPEGISWGAQAYQTVPTVGPSPTSTPTNTPTSTRTVVPSPTRGSSPAPGERTATAAASATPTAFQASATQTTFPATETASVLVVSETPSGESPGPALTTPEQPEATDAPGATVSPESPQTTAPATLGAVQKTSLPAGQEPPGRLSGVFLYILAALILLAAAGWFLLWKRRES